MLEEEPTRPGAASRAFGLAKDGALAAGGWLKARLEQPGVRKRLGWGALLVGTAATIWLGVYRVNPGEVGVRVNNLTGHSWVADREGYHFTVPWVVTFHTLDATAKGIALQTTFKASDGTDVTLPYIVQYDLDKSMADQVLRSAGPGDLFAHLWVRPASRAAIGEVLGQYTAEQIIEEASSLMPEVVELMNERLNPHGVRVSDVVNSSPQLFQAYRDVIEQRKTYDQRVEQHRARAQEIRATQEREVASARFQARQATDQARAHAERIQAEADGYVSRVKLEAEAELITARSQAEALAATGMAEAEGLRESARALTGGGGVNLVALEYAKKLQGIQFTGVPVMQDGRMGQYRIHQASADDGVRRDATADAPAPGRAR